MKSQNFDVIVVGAGHAGIEAARASCILGARTLLVTNNPKRIGFMSCNPSIGGLGKGHIVKEVDALGGLMGLAADHSCIQFKRLNGRKGPAVRGSRAQCDKDLYAQFMSSKCLFESPLSVLEGEVKSLLLDGGRTKGVELADGSRIMGRTVVITTGTFMRGVMHFGLRRVEGGRVGDSATIGLSDQLRAFGFSVGRLKTGTPPRLAAESIDWFKTTPEYGDDEFVPMSYRSPRKMQNPRVPCHITFTTEKTHEIIRNNLHLSPMYCGLIEGIGPRYCPSIEDKVVRFCDRPRHQTFLEPEGLNTNSIYLQGISTSLPEEVQMEFLKTIPGLENVRMLKPGYAVEYDFVEPSQIRHTLETRGIDSLFLAGQINGTSGYEEAAGQGLVAGVNAALKCFGSEEFTLGREEAYIGVLIDDLVTKGTREPYRMMTSRAEHRLVLREDNVLERLTEKAVRFGLLDERTKSEHSSILNKRFQLRSKLRETRISPTSQTQEKLVKMGTPVISKQISLEELLRRSEISCSHLEAFEIEISRNEVVTETVEIEIKYEGYIKRQQEVISQALRLESLRIPADMDYGRIKGLSKEEVEKLERVRPASIGQAGRISGVNPSAIQAILVFLKGINGRSLFVSEGYARQAP